MKNKKNIYSVQGWLPIEYIYEDGLIKTKDNTIIKIINIFPINFNLKSHLEKEAILNSYKLFLKTCNFNFQILIQSNKEDVNQNIKKITQNTQKNSNKINILFNNYCRYIKKLNIENKTSRKKFYILIKKSPENKKISNIDLVREELTANYIKIKECLARCGNMAYEVTTQEEAKKIIYSFMNIKQYLKIF